MPESFNFQLFLIGLPALMAGNVYFYSDRDENFGS